MPRELTPYTQNFSPTHETDVGLLIRATAVDLFHAMQGDAIDTAMTALQQLISRHYHGDRTLSTPELLRAARELRALTHEKASLLRQCRAEAIEVLGLRPRDPLKPGTEEVPIAARAGEMVQAQVKSELREAEKIEESFVKMYGPAAATRPPAQPAPPKSNQNAKSGKPEAA